MRLFDEPHPSVDDPYLRRAYELAELARGRTHPNPLVGCVIVAGDSIVGEGYHVRAGESHAEIVALEAAGPAARGASVYVTLEPCNHQGRTPACAEALISAGVARVVIGMADPNPQVAGGGAERLRQAGVVVEFASDSEPFVSQSEDWISSVLSERPWVTLKTALSLDGHAARRTGERVRITSAEAREITMTLRRRASVVLIGAETLEADDPSLLLRDDQGEPEPDQPVRGVIARSRIPASTSIVDGMGETILLAPESRADQADASDMAYVAYDETGGLLSALKVLRERGHTHVLLEAGPALFTSAWEGDLIDELVLYHSGGMLGPEAVPLFSGDAEISGDTLDARMGIREAGIAGRDAVTVWRPLGQDVGT